MSVSLRIVGLFFSADNLPYTPRMTVKALLDYVMANPGDGGSGASKFGYLANKDALTSGGDSVTAFAARYPQGVTSKTSSTKYFAGDYFLSESTVNDPRYSVWQYYVFNANDVFKPNPMPLQSFATRELDDGDRVIWRLVEILSGPNNVPRVYQNALGFDGANRSVSGYVDATGQIVSGEGAKVQKISTGLYQIDFATPFDAVPAVNATQQFNTGGATAYGDTRDNAVVVSLTPQGCVIVTGDSQGKPSDRAFSFLATGV